MNNPLTLYYTSIIGYIKELEKIASFATQNCFNSVWIYGFLGQSQCHEKVPKKTNSGNHLPLVQTLCRNLALLPLLLFLPQYHPPNIPLSLPFFTTTFPQLFLRISSPKRHHPLTIHTLQQRWCLQRRPQPVSPHRNRTAGTTSDRWFFPQKNHHHYLWFIVSGFRGNCQGGYWDHHYHDVLLHDCDDDGGRDGFGVGEEVLPESSVGELWAADGGGSAIVAEAIAARGTVEWRRVQPRGWGIHRYA